MLRQVHPDTQIDANGLTRLRTIAEAIATSQQNVGIDQWVQLLPGELQLHAISEANKVQPSNKHAQVLEYLIAEILDLAGNRARDRRKVTITEYDILAAISYDEELREFLRNYLPLFPYRVTSNFQNLVIPKNGITYLGRTSEEFKSGLYNVLICLVNYYGQKVDNLSLMNFQTTVSDAIIRRARELNIGTLTFNNLLYAIYQNLQLINVPWVEVFRRCN